VLAMTLAQGLQADRQLRAHPEARPFWLWGYC